MTIFVRCTVCGALYQQRVNLLQPDRPPAWYPSCRHGLEDAEIVGAEGGTDAD